MGGAVVMATCLVPFNRVSVIILRARLILLEKVKTLTLFVHPVEL